MRNETKIFTHSFFLLQHGHKKPRLVARVPEQFFFLMLCFSMLEQRKLRPQICHFSSSSSARFSVPNIPSVTSLHPKTFILRLVVSFCKVSLGLFSTLIFHLKEKKSHRSDKSWACSFHEQSGAARMTFQSFDRATPPIDMFILVVGAFVSINNKRIVYRVLHWVNLLQRPHKFFVTHVTILIIQLIQEKPWWQFMPVRRKK